jgi:hypothetical protein
MEFVCRSVNSNPEKTEEANLVPGTLTVTSMSISLNPDDLPQVEEIINNYDHRSYKMVTDPNGYLRITVDLEAKELVVFHHSHEGLELGRYRSKTPQDMSWQLERAKVISNLGHAMYVGSQLERAWYHLHRGREYIQDKSKLVD